MTPFRLVPGFPIRPFCCLLLLVLSGYAAAQSPDYRTCDYARVDSIMRTAAKKHDRSPGHLAQFIRNTFTAEHEKARAVFCWMAHHIRYDVKGYHKPRKLKDRYDQVFRRRRAVCGGYANLFEALCGLTGVESVTIEGYARCGDERKIGVSQRQINHAWNAVKLGGTWYPVDVTWASGYTNYPVTEFYFDFRDQFFLTRPHQFILTHYPKDISWQLVEDPLPKRSFDFFPLAYEGFYKNDIQLFQPAEGVIRTEAGCQLQFRFKTYADAYKLMRVVISTGNIKDGAEVLPLYREADGYYACYYDVPRKGSYLLYIKINYRTSLVYRIRAPK